eukprot:XP_016665166.1 PREDICTED: uncharacterized protein LOC107885909 [Acyrthosiphon pisum]
MGRAAYKCCVKGCSYKGGTSHRFPNPRKNLLMFQKWMEVIGNDDFKDMESSVIYEKCRVCSNHFSKENFSSGTKVINRNAFPHLHMTNQSPTDTVMPKPIHTSCMSTNLNISGIEELNQSTKTDTVMPELIHTSCMSTNLNISGIEELNQSTIDVTEHNIKCSTADLICIL